MLFSDLGELKDSLRGVMRVERSSVAIENGHRLQHELIDRLAYNAVFNPDDGIQNAATWIIRASAADLGNHASSLQSLYEARSRGHYMSRIVPSISFLAAAYDGARALFRSMQTMESRAVLIEFSADDAELLHQKPECYAATIFAAAIREGFAGPIFLQASHVHFDRTSWQASPQQELARITNLTARLVANGFYNLEIGVGELIDADSTQMVDKYDQASIAIGKLLPHLRTLEPEGIQLCIGASLLGTNDEHTQPEELCTFLEGYGRTLRSEAGKNLGLIKVAANCGTSRGGLYEEDGQYVDPAIDMQQVDRLYEVAVRDHDLAGIVLHGTSTLSDDLIQQLAREHVLEAHLATAYLNTILDSQHLPATFKEEMIEYQKDALRSAKRGDQNEDQFLKATRKNALGPFKRKFWDLPQDTHNKLIDELTEKLKKDLQTFGVAETNVLIRDTVIVRPTPSDKPEDLG